MGTEPQSRWVFGASWLVNCVLVLRRWMGMGQGQAWGGWGKEVC